jgi:hypothetical protein
MGRYDAVVSLLVLGPQCAAMREAMLSASLSPSAGAAAIVAASPLEQGCILREAAERFETASLALRSSFIELVRLLGDDPFARKW